MNRSFVAAGVLLVLPVLQAGIAPGAAAQSPGDAGPRFAVVPIAGPTWFGNRFTAALGSNTIDVKPTTGLALGGQAEVWITQRVTLTGMGTWSSLSYRVTGTAPGDEIRTSGKQQIVRLAGGVILRLRPGVPGYATGGVAVNRVTPGEDVYLDEEAERNEWGGFAGVGLELGSGGARLRLEGRSQVSRISTENASRSEVIFVPVDWAVDWMLLAGVVFRF